MKSYTITVNGKVYEVTVEEGISGNSQPSPVSAAPQAPSSAPAAPKKNIVSVGNVKVNAPMPGKILAVKTSVGQSVKRGDVLMILEAMKMENEICAPANGTVSAVSVNQGATVETGTLLCTIV